MFDLIISNFARHISLDKAEEEFATSLLKFRQIKKNTVLLHSGEVCKKVYFVNKGCLRLYYTDSSGKDHIISFMPENWWAVDIASFYSQKPAAYSIEALEDCEILELSYADQQKLYEQVPKFERFFRILTQNGFILYQRRIIQNLSQTAEKRYEQFRRRYPKLEHRIAQKHIAAYIGVTPVFVSVLRKRR